MPTRSKAEGTSLSETMEESASQYLVTGVLWKSVGLLSPCGGKLHADVRIRDREVTIGRFDEVDVSLPLITVSRRHARIVPRGGEFVIEDLGSANGTFVDGVPIVSCVLRDGDVIQIGTCRMSFHRLLEPQRADSPCQPCENA